MKPVMLTFASFSMISWLDAFIILALLFGLSVALHCIVICFNPIRCYKEIKNAKKVLFVTAHPDDECLFFGPTIRRMCSSGHEVHLICLSSGNYYMHGCIRKNELRKSCDILGIPSSNITVIEHSKMPDDPLVNWQKEIVKELILNYAMRLSADTVITFDENGVSGHLNHISLYHSVKDLCNKKQLPQGTTIYTLTSVNILRKYSSFLNLPISFLFSSYLYTSNYTDITLTKSAMQAHISQLVWFRKLYLIFSSYIIMNSLEPIQTTKTTTSSKKD